MNVIYDMVKNIAVYLILVTIVMNLLGKSSYKKYVSVFTGMLLVYIVITPLLNLFDMGDKMDFFFDKNSLSVEMAGMNVDFLGVEDSQKKRILEEYKERIYSQIEAVLLSYQLYVVACAVELEEEEESEKFGTVKRLEVTASYRKKEEKDIKVTKEIKIDKVEIEPREISEGVYERIENLEQNKDSKKATAAEQEIVDVLAKFYTMDPENVIATIIE